MFVNGDFCSRTASAINEGAHRPSFMESATFYNTHEIFGFAAVFAQNGYHVPGQVEEQAA
jgi:hypothetical protein